MINLVYEDAVWSRCADSESLKLLSPILVYEYYVYRQTGKGMARAVKKATAVDSSGYFNSGWIPKIKRHCKKVGLAVCLEKEPERQTPKFKAELPNKTFRPDQEFLLRRVYIRNRGFFESPTGSGKSIIIAGILSAYRDKQALIIVPSKTLLHQMVSDLKEEGIKNIGLVGDGNKAPNKVTVGIINSVVNNFKEDWVRKAEVVIVDEAHGINKDNGYDTVLLSCKASIRIGLTATRPKADAVRGLYLEGLLGEYLGRVPADLLIEKGVLAKPNIILVEPEFPLDTDLIKNYKDSYETGIVQNSHRNKLIAKICEDMKRQKRTSLVIIWKTKHGEKILDELERIGGLRCVFVHGKTKGKERERVRKLLDAKEYDVVVASDIWKQGVNIKSLDCVINAAGWKAEIPVMQKLGRGLRTTDVKDTLYYVDFMDTGNRYLAFHSLKRITYYIQNGWEIMKYEFAK